MQRVGLEAELKNTVGKGVARKLRARSRIPGVVYGKGFENLSIHVDAKTLEELFPDSRSLNKIIDLKIPEHGTVTALLKEYQAHYLTRKFLHVDFVKLDLTQKIRVEVPLRVVGKAEGVKEGGVLDIIRREVPVICLPTEIPDAVEVDVSALKIGQSIHLKQVKLPANIEVPQEVDYTLVTVAATRAEEVKAADTAAKEPEVLTAKKPAEGAAADDKKAPAGKDKK